MSNKCQIWSGTHWCLLSGSLSLTNIDSNIRFYARLFIYFGKLNFRFVSGYSTKKTRENRFIRERERATISSDNTQRDKSQFKHMIPKKEESDNGSLLI